MKNKHYTPDGNHPEDAIYKVKTFINELTKVQEQYFQKLYSDLNLNEDGIDFLFDYIYNSGDEGEKLEFTEWLDRFNTTYDELYDK